MSKCHVKLYSMDLCFLVEYSSAGQIMIPNKLYTYSIAVHGTEQKVDESCTIKLRSNYCPCHGDFLEKVPCLAYLKM